MLRLARMDEAAFVALLGVPAVALSVALFHAQQAAEKALESVMCLRGLEFRRTHDLEELAAQLVDAQLVPAIDFVELRCLSPYAVKSRYDDTAVHTITGARAIDLVASLLAWADAQAGSELFQ